VAFGLLDEMKIIELG